MIRSLTAPWRSARTCFTAACLVVTPLQAGAVVKQITATFNPDPSNPNKNEFRNTTPNSGFCIDHRNICEAHKIFSVRAFLSFPHNGPIEPNHSDVRKGAMIKTPATWRTLMVRERTSGIEAPVEIRIAGMGGTYSLSEDVRKLTGIDRDEFAAHRALWTTGSWNSAPNPCVAIGTTIGSHVAYSFFWLTPEEVVCDKQSRFLIPGFAFRYLDFTYELRTPDPLKMPTGVYEGTQIYSIGPNGDFDLGDIVVPPDAIIQLDFTLTVEHTLKVEIPPGGNRVELLPQGGWQAWLQQGRRPARLFRDQTFTISASTRFKMNLECQYSPDGKTCGVRDAVSGHAVPLNVSVSLPHGLSDVGGLPVNRRQLLRDGSGTELFQPGFYVDRKPGTLHFEIPPDDVAEMIRPGSQRQYSGSVTVIWDSDV